MPLAEPGLGATPTTGPLQRLRTPAVVAAVAVAVSTLTTVAGFVGAAAGIDFGIAGGPTGAGVAIRFVAALALLTAAIAIMSWLHRALTNAGMIPEARRRWSPGWAVGAWFVPVANLVLPALVVHDAARASVAPHARHARVLMTTLVLAWWLGFIGSSSITSIAQRSEVDLTTLWILDGLAVLVRITSAAALIALLAQVTRHQERRFVATAARWDPAARPPIPAGPPTGPLKPTTAASTDADTPVAGVER